MNLKIYNVSLIILSLVSCTIFAQNNNKLLKANEKFNNYAYVDASELYLEIVKKGETSLPIYERLGDCFYFTGRLKESMEWYAKIYTEYPDKIKKEYLFRYSQSLKSHQNYEESDKVMEKFKVLINGDQRADFFTNSTDYLRFIDLQSGKFELKELEINSPVSDHSPSYNQKGGLTFVSSREGKSMSKVIHKWNEMPFSDFFTSTIIEEESGLAKPKRVKGELNSKFHESSITYSKDGTTVYFTRNNYVKKKAGSNKKGTMLIKLFEATLEEEGGWSNIQELPFTSDEYSTAHPSLSTDGTKLYFASDMPGTKGLSDIYVVDVFEDGTFGEPQNMGDQINTEGRETFPFISDDGKLYFSSDGHIGLGGLDVFITIPENDGFSRPFNVGSPINSPNDDFSFIINNGNGYFASNRDGGYGSDDIYQFKQTAKLITNCNQFVVGKVVNSETGEIMANAQVTLLDSNYDVVDGLVTDDSGDYRFTNLECGVTYTVKVEKLGYRSEFILETSYVLEHENTMRLRVEVEKITHILQDLEMYGELKDGDDLAKTLNLKPMYFDSNKTTYSTNTVLELEKIITFIANHPYVDVIVRSHTDSKGSKAFNMILSRKRAQMTMNYIIAKGKLNPSRVIAEGLGETELLNKCNSCTHEQNTQNRRSEFIVVKRSNSSK